MAKYITLPIDTDPEDLIADAIAYLQGKIPGWEPAEGNLDYWIIQAVSSGAAELRDVASAVPEAIFRTFGDSLVGLPPIDAAPATVQTTWTVQDNAGYTIAAGTQVGFRSLGDDLVPFYVQSDVVIPPGAVATAAGAVTLVAVIPGADASALGAPGAALELIDPLSYVVSVLMVAATTGGQDAEADDDYLDRLNTNLQLMAPRLILPRDAEVFSRNIAGVWRAMAVDGWDAVLATGGHDRTISVALMDAAGNNVSAGVKAAVDADLQARREVNFLIYEIDQTRALINVTYDVKVLPGYLPADVVAAVNSALQNFLNPLFWGSPPAGDARDWVNTPTVRYLEIAQIINAVQGVDYITTTAGNFNLQIAIQGNALGRVDLALPGVAPTAIANVLTGTAA